MTGAHGIFKGISRLLQYQRIPLRCPAGSHGPGFIILPPFLRPPFLALDGTFLSKKHGLGDPGGRRREGGRGIYGRGVYLHNVPTNSYLPMHLLIHRFMLAEVAAEQARRNCGTRKFRVSCFVSLFVSISHPSSRVLRKTRFSWF